MKYGDTTKEDTMETTANLPAEATWHLTDLTEKRIAELNRRLAKLAPNQWARRRDVERELADLTKCLAIMKTAQTAFAMSICEKLGV